MDDFLIDVLDEGLFLFVFVFKVVFEKFLILIVYCGSLFFVYIVLLNGLLLFGLRLLCLDCIFFFFSKIVFEFGVLIWMVIFVFFLDFLMGCECWILELSEFVVVMKFCVCFIFVFDLLMLLILLYFFLCLGFVIFVFEDNWEMFLWLCFFVGEFFVKNLGLLMVFVLGLKWIFMWKCFLDEGLVFGFLNNIKIICVM